MIKGAVKEDSSFTALFKLLFTYDANPYGTLDDLYNAPDPAITQVINTKIRKIKYYSTKDAVVTTSQLSTTKAVTINQELQLHFRKQEGMWKRSKIDPPQLQIEMLDDIEEKAATLLQHSPYEVEKVLSDLYEPGELEEPYEYEEVLYLDHTDGKRWTFYTSDLLYSNY
ncbi:MAG TPA: hypothetical protein IAA29_04890 [Candidatus Paenibacillus intestinavium]|nr:hypothetical protein [Candidatus Paenibacillus intestinavium]